MEQFQNYTNTNLQLGAVDVSHCISGKAPFTDGPAGLAYLGVVCFQPSYAYGITQDYGRTVNIVLVAHEIGHNFGADHDASNSGYIMAPVADPTATGFSTLSKSAVATHLASYSSCLGTSDGGSGGGGGGGGGSLDGYSVAFSGTGTQKGCAFRAVVTDAASARASGVSVNFEKRQRGGTYASVKAKSTNSVGIARYTATRSGVYRATLSDDSILSSTLRCKIQ